MAKTIVGLFDDATEVEAVVQELTRLGVARDQISLMANRGEVGVAASREGAPETTTSGEDAMTGAGIGAMAGGLGGLIVGLVALPIPGLGPVIAAGPIGAALMGAGIGAVTGGVIGALTHVGVPTEHADHYAEGVRRGGTLVIVNSPEDLASHVASVMHEHHAVDVNERAARWREDGWKGFDASAPVLSADEVQRERVLYANRDLNRGQQAFPAVADVLADKAVIQRTQTVREPVRSTGVDVDQDALQRLSQPGERTSQSPASPSRR
jgi:uncharacterized membrane protein